MFASLDYDGYIDYIKGKFVTLKSGTSIIKAETVTDPMGEYMTKISQTNPATNQSAIVYYRIKVDNNKIVKGDLCMF